MIALKKILPVLAIITLLFSYLSPNSMGHPLLIISYLLVATGVIGGILYGIYYLVTKKFYKDNFRKFSYLHIFFTTWIVISTLFIFDGDADDAPIQQSSIIQNAGTDNASIDDILNGEKVSSEKNYPCPRCGGLGLQNNFSEDGMSQEKCTLCQGSGKVSQAVYENFNR